MRFLRIALVAALPACATMAGPAAGPTPAPSYRAVPDDACALVTVAEVEGAAGSSVVRSGVVPDERLHVPDPSQPNPCEYVTHGRHESILIGGHPGGAREFERFRDRDPSNTERVEALGEEAFTHGLASLFVRIGEGYFVLSTQHGAGREGIEDLRRLALTAVDRLRA